MSLFGTFYSVIATSAGAESRHLIEIVRDTLLGLPGHAMAGLIARDVTKNEAARGVVHVFGDDPSGVYRAMFHIDDARSRWTLLEPSDEITLAMWSDDDRWALVVGDHKIDFPHVMQGAGDGLMLVRRSDNAAPSSK